MKKGQKTVQKIHQKNRRAGKVRHIPQSSDTFICNFGNGDFNEGIKKVGTLLRNLQDNGNKIEDVKLRVLMNDCDTLMVHLRDLYSVNHFDHFGEFPLFFKMFLKTGDLDIDILRKGRKEKSLFEHKKKGCD